MTRIRRAVVLVVVATVALTLAVPVAAQAGGRRDRCDADPAATRDLRYRKVPRGVDPNLLSLDVYPAAECPAPVVVWVHGGGFRKGDKANGMRDKVAHWNGLGYTVVSVNYRLTDDVDPDTVRYPTHAQDVASAVSWVHDHVAEYGGDPDRIALVGHSAGAQLVASVATDPALLRARDLAPADLACVAPLDTEGFDVTRRAAAGDPIYANTFGADPVVWRAASPITHVTPDADVPAHLLVARGSQPRRRVVDRYAEALRVAGAPVTVVDGAGLSHADVNRLIGEPGDAVMTPALDTFLAQCFAGGATLSASTGPGAAGARAERCPAEPTVTRDVVYRKVPKGVDPQRLTLDVYSAAECPAPVVVWIHGGGWRRGDKRFQMTDKVRHWNAQGYTVVSVNYRLTDPSAPDAVQHPTHAEDVAAAVAWVHDDIAAYGGDPTRVALLGHSAGAHLAAIVATDERLLDAHDLAPSDLACVAPIDITFDVAPMAGRGVGIYVDAFGTDPADWADASPITHVEKGTGTPPHLVVARGAATRAWGVQTYVDALTEAGVPASVIDATGLSHADVNTRIGAPGDTVMTPALDAFLDSCFAPATPAGDRRAPGRPSSPRS